MRRAFFWVGGVIILTALFFLGLGYFVRSFTRESTDDAFLDGHIVAIAPKVAGQVQAVHVRHYQAVKAGDLMVEIDPRDFEAQLNMKQASVANAEANRKLVQASFELMRTRVESSEGVLHQAEADAAAAKATADVATANLSRVEGLFKQQIIAQSEYDTAKASAISAQAALTSAQEKVRTEESHVKEARTQLEGARIAMGQANAQMAQTAADLKLAELNLSYTKISAPQTGIIARKNAEPGSYLQVGQQILALVPDEIWVTANFKETQLARIHPGQSVEVKIDSVPDRLFKAHIESMQPGSGARFSLLPPENAVGNFVKIVQRVPVRIRFDEALKADHVLGPGMSVSPSVVISTFRIPRIFELLLAVVLALAVVLIANFFFLRRQAKRAEPPK
jgi:membrane fusion protein (multidrug efflux system)